MGGMIQMLANYDPEELARKNRESDASIAALQAQTAGTQVGTQSKQLENQLTQQSLKDADIVRRAYVNTSGDPAELRRYMLSNGISAPGFMGWQKHDMDLRQNTMKLTSEQHDLLAKTHQDAGNMLDSFRAIKDPEQQRQVYEQFLPSLRKLAPDVQWESPLTLQPEDLDLYNGVLGHAQATLAAAKTKAETEKAQAEIPLTAQKVEEARATTAKTQAEAGGLQRTQALQELSALNGQDPDAYNRWAGLHPEMSPPTTYDPSWAQRQIRSAVPMEKQPEFDLNTYKAKMGLVGNSEYDQFLTRYAQSLGKTPATLTAAEGLASFGKFAELKQDPVMRANAIAMKSLSEAQLRLSQGLMPTPEDIEVQAKALLNHTLSPTQFQELKTSRANTGAKVFSRAMQMDPNFSLARAESEFKAMESTEKDFTSGKEAGLVRSNNNALEHLALLNDARMALRNGDLPALNRLANWIGAETGSSAATVFDHIAARVGDEVQKAFIPGGGGQAERAEAGKGSYSSKMGDAQIAANLRADVALMDSQQRHLVDQYKRGTYGQGAQQLFTDAAQAARDRLLGRPAGGQAPAQAPGAAKIIVKAGDGSLHPFDTEQQAQAFESSAKRAGGTTSRVK